MKVRPVTRWPVMTILRGKVVAEEGKILGASGDGAFLNRELSPYAAHRRGRVLPERTVPSEGRSRLHTGSSRS
jgi:hypothetical protein